MYNLLLEVNKLGIWSIIDCAIVLLGFILGIIYIFWAKRNVKNLNFFVYPLRDDSNYPLKIHLEIRNYTGRSVVISYAYFQYNKLCPDEKARGDTLTRKYELKFPSEGYLIEVECFLKHKDKIDTWISLDPKHTDEEIKNAIEERKVGIFSCFLTWIEEKPKSHKLKRRV